MRLRDSHKFHVLLIVEAIVLPLLYLTHWAKVFFCNQSVGTKIRESVQDAKIKVIIHEWGGYPVVRSKTIKHGATFECGLKSQIERFSNKDKFEMTISMSDIHRFKERTWLCSNYNVINVDNKGMDFTGYGVFFEKIKDSANSYIILTNTSVNSLQTDFIDDYIQYMENNRDVGMLGVSYCTKMIQTLMRKNFIPHLQSFFLLTTTQVLNEVVALNKGQFPGCGIDHKLLLIREGEIKISQLIQQLGYRLAVVNPLDGIPYKFTNYRNWSLPKGDIRQILTEPNKITSIHK